MYSRLQSRLKKLEGEMNPSNGSKSIVVKFFNAGDPAPNVQPGEATLCVQFVSAAAEAAKDSGVS